MDLAVGQEGGSTTKKFRVELKKKPATKKVHLQPKKADPKPEKSQKESTEGHTTRRVRRFTLGVSALHKRMTRAKKVQRKIKDMPIAKLREWLLSKKLIQPTSKAPEAVLRQMATDAQLVAGRTL